jgi:hypothetical protein
MSDVLIRIKRAVLAANYAFSGKARLEVECDDLTELDVARIDSEEPQPRWIGVYSKGMLLRESGVDKYYFLISSQRAL